MSGTSNRSLPNNMRNFGATPPAQVSRSTFNLSKPWKGTFNAGLLIPFFNSEGLPGDSRKVRVQAIIRMLTPLTPYFDNVYVDFHFWWTPNRQLWTNWVKLMGEQENPGDSIDYLVPTVGVQDTSGQDFKDLVDNMGVPVSNIAPGNFLSLSALPLRAYNRIYNFHYRDQNLIQSVPQKTGDGTDPQGDYKLLKRGKRHDYLTAALPFQQKGDPVAFSLGTTADVFADSAGAQNVGVEDGVGGSVVGLNATGTGNAVFVDSGLPGTRPLKVDLAGATGVTITDLRQSIAVQHVLERDARSGTRYPEILLSRYRVMDPQMLVLQRPEFLGGGTRRVNVSPIPMTAVTDDTAGVNQGDLAAVATSMIDGIGFTRSFTEHGFITGILSVRADLTYQQGLERMWSRRARFDFYHPELAHLSEEAILSKEIYADGTAADDDVWGYIGAYDSYRYGMGLVTGRFRSTDAASLDVWHLSQEFASRPTLNQTFIEENPPIDRVVKVVDEPQFKADIFINDIAARGMPLSGIPGLSRI